MTTKASDRLDLALPVGISLILSTAALLLFPGLAAVACQFLVGAILVGIFVSRRVLNYARERRMERNEEPLASRRTVDRSDMLVLIAFATFYAAVSGPLTRAGWPDEAVRICALFLLLSILLLKPKIAARLKTKTMNCVPPFQGTMSPSVLANDNFPEMLKNEKGIQ